MYLVYCLLLFFLVYIGPALALYPKLILSSRTAIAVPFISIFIIAVTKKLLVLLGIFSHDIVLTLQSAFFIIAVYRIANVTKRSKLDWPESHVVIYLLNFGLAIYYAAKLGTSSFYTDDEIYSWNMWAIQHYFGEKIDFYYTVYPYPQFFSILIAYCYKVLGNIELQLPIRALFAIFPFCLLTAIGIVPQKANYKNIFIYILLIILLVFGIRIGKHFDVGLADPLMASSFIVSIFLFIQYSENTKNMPLLWISAVCAIVASYSKQPALIWAIVAFPLLTMNSIIRKRFPLISLVPAVMLMLAGLLWLFGDGSNFYNNEGVINASQQGRNLFQQLIFASEKYFIDKPFILLLLVGSYMSLVRSKKYTDIFYILLIPSLLAWFIFGAYGLRLGIHVVSLSALLLAATNFNLPIPGFQKISENIGTFFYKRKLLFISTFLLIATVASVLAANKSINEIGDAFDFYKGGKNTISKYFGKDAEFIYQKIYNRSDILLWIPSNYIYGIFYSHNNVMRPNYRNTEEYSIRSLATEIDTYHPDYLFYSGPRVAYGPGSDLLYELAEKQCPDLFEKVAAPPNKFGYIVYKLKKDKILLDQCLKRLTKQPFPSEDALSP